MTRSFLLYHKNFQNRKGFSADVVQVTQRLGTKLSNSNLKCLKYSVHWLSVRLQSKDLNGRVEVDTSSQDGISMFLSILSETPRSWLKIESFRERTWKHEVVQIKPLNQKGDIGQGTVIRQMASIAIKSYWKIMGGLVHMGSNGKYKRNSKDITPIVLWKWWISHQSHFLPAVKLQFWIYYLHTGKENESL